MTNKNRENYDNIHADNLVKRSGVPIYRKKNVKIKPFKEKASGKFKNLAHPYLDPDLSMHVNKHPIHLVTQSL